MNVWPFKRSALLPQASAELLIDMFSWAMRHFDAQELMQRSQLILPNDEFFPNKVNSSQQKAQQIFNQTIRYAGLRHYPFVLLEVGKSATQPITDLDLVPIERNSALSAGEHNPLYAGMLEVVYHPAMSTKPMDLCASYAQVMAAHLILQSKTLTAKHQTYFNEASEVLAAMFGFGVMLVNSAYSFRGGCGSCFHPQANRNASLNEHESLFVLAIYCYLKQLPYWQFKAYLKPHLRTAFKQANLQLLSMRTQTLTLDKLRSAT
jgi:BarA-like signal transduction histidine kinase